MKVILPILLLAGCLILWLSDFTNVQTISLTTKNANTNALPSSQKNISTSLNISQQFGRITDSRDGETYATVKIGQQTWMAENLRYNAPGSLLNPDNPSITYGRLYDGITAEAVCLDGWHLPSDLEWSTLEMTLGLPADKTTETGWRGTHGALKMKAITGWIEKGNETNSSGFNAFPAGFYFSDSFGGLGTNTGYWSSSKRDLKSDLLHKNWNKAEAPDNSAWLRFIGSGPAYTGMNRFRDNKTSWKVSCRCVKD